MTANTWNAAASWTTIGSTELDSLPSGSVGYLTTPGDNTTALNTDAWFSVALGSVAASAAAPSLDIYLLPLNADGVTYGDQAAAVEGTQSTTLPSPGYYVGSIRWQTNATAAALTGQLKMQQELPPSKYLIAVVNNLGSALNAAGNTLSISTNSVA